MRRILLCLLLIALLAMSRADDVSDTVSAAFSDLGGTSSGLTGDDGIADAMQLFNEAPIVDTPIIQFAVNGVIVASTDTENVTTTSNLTDTNGFGRRSDGIFDCTCYKVPTQAQFPVVTATSGY